MTTREHAALKALLLSDTPLTRRELAKVIGCGSTTAQHVVDLLEARGYVSRRAHQARSVVVERLP